MREILPDINKSFMCSTKVSLDVIVTTSYGDASA